MTELVSSSADSFSGKLDADGFTTTIAPFHRVSGSAPPAYDDTSRIASFDRTYDLTPAEANTLSLTMQTTHMVNNAESAGIGVDEIGASGAADLGSASFVLADTLGPMLPLSIFGLSVNATGIRSGSDSSFVFGPNEGSLAGDASFHLLTVTGALVGGDTLTFSGNAAPDTVLYSESDRDHHAGRADAAAPAGGDERHYRSEHHHRCDRHSAQPREIRRPDDHRRLRYRPKLGQLRADAPARAGARVAAPQRGEALGSSGSELVSLHGDLGGRPGDHDDGIVQRDRADREIDSGRLERILHLAKNDIDWRLSRKRRRRSTDQPTVAVRSGGPCRWRSPNWP